MKTPTCFTSRQNNVAVCLTVTFAILLAPSVLAQLSLERNVGVPNAYNWDAAKAAAKDPALNGIFNVLKKYKIPSATIGYQLNPDPKSISYAPPTKWRNPQSWWMAGYGINYRAPMRLASISKPLLAIAYQNTPVLRASLDQSFYQLWKANVGALPEPKDSRVKQITVRHLLNHVSGFRNGTFSDGRGIGNDPAYTGKTIEAQLPGILKDRRLFSAPGTMESYSNFSFMILARLAQGLTKQHWINVLRARFPVGAPIYEGRDAIPVAANAVPSAGAAEPSIYYIQGNDGQFVMEPKIGEGNLLSNVATLTWIATQYWIWGAADLVNDMDGENPFGMSFASRPPVPRDSRIFNGSMPGTMTSLAQYTTPKGRVSAMCVLVNTRIPGSNFLNELNTEMVLFLRTKFGTL